MNELFEQVAFMGYYEGVVVIDDFVAFYNRNLRYITGFRKHLFRIAEILDTRIIIQNTRSRGRRRIVIHNIVIFD